VFHGRVHGRKSFAESRVQGADRAVAIRNGMKHLRPDPDLHDALGVHLGPVPFSDLRLVVEHLE
jgi:hypothetical protein